MPGMSRVIVPVAALMITGCSSVIVEDLAGPRFSYFDGDFEHATNKGSIVTLVTGNPFGIDQTQFGNAVRRDMRNQVDVATEANFVAADDGATVPPYRVVVAFNPPSHIGNHELCENGAKTPGRPPSNNVEVRMAFCYGDSLKSGSAAWVSGLSGPTDPRFGELVRKAAHSLVPSQDGEDVGESGILP